MEINYNLTRDDYLRGLYLHEKRLKGGWSVFRWIFRILFLIPAAFSALTLAMLAVIALTGNWEETFTEILGPLCAMLMGSLILLRVFSPRFRALVSLRRRGDGKYFFGAHTLSLTSAGVLVRYGEDRLELIYPDLAEVWEKSGYICLCRKSGLWYVLPPCAFPGAEQRQAFLSKLRAARAGEVPQGCEVQEPSCLPEADTTLAFTWTPEELEAALTRANLYYGRTRLFWRPVRVVTVVLGLAAMVSGAFLLAAGEAVGAGILLIGAALGVVPLLLLLPPMVRWMVARQMRQGDLHGLLDGEQTALFWDGGFVELHGGGRESAAWDRVGAVRSEAEGLCLLRRDNKLHVFPAGAFRDRAEQEEAAEYVRAHMGK